MNIASFVLNNVVNDSRVLKTAVSVTAHGRVTIVGLRYPGDDEYVHDTARVARVAPYHRTSGRLAVLAKLVTMVRYYTRAFCGYRKVDAAICNDVGTLPLGVLIKICNPRVKLFYDSHELQSETRWLGSLGKRLVRVTERACLRWVDQMVVVSPSIAEAYAKMFGVSRPMVIMNCPLYAQVTKSDRLRETVGVGPDTYIYLYQGGFTPGRGIEEVVAAFEHPDLDGSDVVAVFMGYGVLQEWLHKKARMHSRIRVLDAVPPDQVLQYTAGADFGLCTIRNDCLNYLYCLPNKLFEYMMAGVPVIASNLVEVGRIVRDYRIGLVVNMDDTRALIHAVLHSMSVDRAAMSARELELRRSFSWEEQAASWRRIFCEHGMSSVTAADGDHG